MYNHSTNEINKNEDLWRVFSIGLFIINLIEWHFYMGIVYHTYMQIELFLLLEGVAGQAKS